MTRGTALPLVLALAGCAGARDGAPPQRAAAPDPPPGWDLGWAHGAVVYEVFVRSFADADGDGVGDLRGLADRLDYLDDGDPGGGDDLGVDALWLMPIFESPSYHGYDTVDYERVDADYGTAADLDRLLAEAHRRGLRVIVDLVLNHTSDRHPWFVESAAAADAPRRDWYVWRHDDPGWTQPWGGDGRTWHPRAGAYYYGVFWSGMPDLNWRHPPVRAEMARLAAHWLRRGVDGFRLDATRHLVANGPGALQNDQPETHAYLRELAAGVRRVRRDALLVGENWTDTATIATYYGSPASVDGGDELPANFNFPLAAAIVSGVAAGSAAPVTAVLRDMAALYPAGVLDAPFLTNHDQVRVATQLAGDPARLRLAAAVLLTLPGAPFLYYGEEIGMRNAPERRDEAKRTPLAWDASERGGFTTGTPWQPFAPGRESANVAAQRADPGSLLAHYRRLLRLRRGSPALRRGALRLLASPEPVLAFRRDAGADGALAVFNLGDGETRVALDLGRPAAGGLDPLLVSAGVAAGAGEGGATTLRLPGRAFGVWRLP